ncbi:MAG: response regulator [Gammaproteobacteria bacterium]|nr:MAG: response regulator [Gammaproteobacteria bacterium]
MSNPFSVLFKAYQRKKFLIVDDFDSFVFSLKQMLRRLGAEHIESAPNGERALDMALQRHYDVVLCDYNLGDGKNGQQVLEELRHRGLVRHQDIFIMISAESARDWVFAAIENAPDEYLTKPITQSILQNRLDRILAQKETLRPMYAAMDAGDYSKALSACEQALAASPDYRPLLIKTKAYLYLQVGDVAAARALYEAALKRRPLQWARFGLARTCLMEGNLPRAIELLQLLVAEYPNMVQAWDLLSDALKQCGDTHAAEEALAEATRLSPRTVVRQQQLAGLANLNDNPDRAVEASRQAVKHARNSVHDTPELYLNHAHVLTDVIENHPEKIAELGSQVKETLAATRQRFGPAAIDPVEMALIDARMRLAEGEHDAARKIVEDLANTFSGQPVRQQSVRQGLAIGRGLLMTGAREQAEKLLYRLIQDHPDDSQLPSRVEELLDEPLNLRERLKARELNRQGIRLYDQNEFERAIEMFAEAARLAPRHVALNLNLLQALMRLPDDRRAAYRDIEKSCLARLKGLSQQHRQYRRYAHLISKIKDTEAPS